jgi:hypothetical protein
LSRDDPAAPTQSYRRDDSVPLSRGRGLGVVVMVVVLVVVEVMVMVMVVVVMVMVMVMVVVVVEAARCDHTARIPGTVQLYPNLAALEGRPVRRRRRTVLGHACTGA